MKKLITILILVVFLSGCAEKPMTGIEWFQTGNTQDITKLQPKLSEELEDNRIGCMLSTDEEINTLEWPCREEFIRDINKLGLKRVRLSIDHFDFDKVIWGETSSQYSIKSHHDETIDKLIEKNIKIRYCLLFWDSESPGQSEIPEGEREYVEEETLFSRFKTEEEIQRYLDYTRFIVNHFKGKIQYYEILNEPITGSGSQQSVEVEDYIKLVKKVVPVIREEDPEAKVVIGAIPNLYEPEDYQYLLTLLNSDLMPLVDGISFHGLHGVSPDYEHREFYYQYPDMLMEIKNTASANGFKGEYFGDELVWRTSKNTLESEPWTYTEIGAAKYYARGIVTQLGLDITTGFVELDDRLQSPREVMGKVFQNLATVMAGAEPKELPIEIQSEANDIKHYIFSLSNGDKLIALWTDGVAIDENHGINANLILSDINIKDVTAIDVLNGYTQQIIVNGDKIENLIVRDYPLVIKIK